MPFSSANLKLLDNLTFANFLTCCRMILAPVIVYYICIGQQAVAFALFFLASLTDFFDGFFARKNHTTTSLGKILDPLADKVLVAFIYVALMVMGKVPVWLLITILLRDFLIIGGLAVGWRYSLPLKMKPIFSSKLNTFLQLLLCVLLLCPFYIHEGFIQWLIYVTFVSTVYSGGAYARIFVQAFRR